MTLVEVVVASVIVATLLVAALTTVAGAASAGRALEAQERAVLLAEELMNEIVMLPYEDPDEPTLACGPETGESGRAAFDDVDDYHGWTESPPQDAQGVAKASMSAWARQVTVTWVHAADLTTASAVESGVKRIEVVVLHDGTPLATLVAYRTRGWDRARP